MLWCLFFLMAPAVRAADGSTLTIDLVDPNPSLLSEAGQVISSESAEAVDRMTGELPTRVGIVTDGVSALLLRVRGSNAVTFSISPRLGQLRAVSGETESGHALTVQPVRASDDTSWALALYLAPDDLPGGSVRREVTISAREMGGAGSVRLRLENLPVLLVHGVWSSSASWNGLREFLKARGHNLCETSDCMVNYGPVQPAPSFDPFAATPENQFAINHLIEKTTNTLNAVRSNGVAAAQVDVIGHSLGGLIARARVVVPDAERAYRRKDNFLRGDFHKLITIGTPHRGTPTVDFLISNRCVRSSFFQGNTLESYMSGIGYPFRPAIEEMRTVSAALTNLGATPQVPAHAIVGIAPRTSRTEQLLDSLPGALGFSLTLDGILGGNGHHDTIVPRESQAGGLAKPAVTLVRSIVHTDVAPLDVSETESRVVWRRVAQLLRAPSASKLFSNFTALVTNTVPATPPCE